jgi:TonB family protein
LKGLYYQNIYIYFRRDIEFSVISEEAGSSRNDSIKRFNEAQRCFKETVGANGQQARAIQCAESSLAVGNLLFESTSNNIAGLTYHYGTALTKGGSASRKKSVGVLEDALTLYQSLYGVGSIELVDLLIDLGNAKNAVRPSNTKFKRSSYKQALKILSSNGRDDSLDYAQVQLAISVGVFQGRITPKAVSFSSKHAKGAYDIFLQELGPTSVGATLASFQMGKNKMFRRSYGSAIPLLERALSNPSVVQYVHGFLIKAYAHKGRQALATFHAQELGKLMPGQENQDYVPVYVTQPTYPSAAQKSGTEGYAVIEVTISTEGLAIKSFVVEEKPRSARFGKAALKAAKTLRYVPRFVDGEAVEVPGVLYKYTFQMAH